MTHVIQPFLFLVITLAGWLNRQQQSVIDCIIEEILEEQLGDRRMRFTVELRRGDEVLKHK